ncbi:MAG: NADH-quinone oxidoreductase subunit C [Salinivirgaceae bacterium]|jgi:NADH:ubiquinone oxidoreductase subunit C
MDQSSLQQTIERLVPSAVFKTNLQFVELAVAASEFHQVAKSLKENTETQFDFLSNQTGMDFKGELTLVCHLRSTTLKHSCVLKTIAPNREKAELDTISDLWPAAEYFEREIFDLLGIRFTNHPDMRRLFLEDDFVGHPLRKDFIDTVNIIER